MKMQHGRIWKVNESEEEDDDDGEGDDDSDNEGGDAEDRGIDVPTDEDREVKLIT